jgi:hypothetical protein
MSLVSVKEEPVDAAIFEVPKDYKEMAQTTLPGAPGAVPPAAPGAAPGAPPASKPAAAESKKPAPAKSK